jgi:hypothetical protein
MDALTYCRSKSRPELDAIAMRVLGQPTAPWKKLDKENLCFALQDEFSARSKKIALALKNVKKVKKTKTPEKDGKPVAEKDGKKDGKHVPILATLTRPTRPESDDMMSRRVKLMDVFMEHWEKATFQRTLGKGAQGRADLFTWGKKLQFVLKENTIDPLDRSIFARALQGREKAHGWTIVAKGKVAQTETGVEICGSLLASALVEQNICPHFPLLYDVDVTRDKLFTYMEPIPGATTLSKWKKGSRSSRQWFSMVFQIMAAVRSLSYQFGLVHDDLHDGNVMVYELGSAWKGGYFHYVIDGTDYYVPVFGKMACVIDFGRMYMEKGPLQIKWHRKDRKADLKELGTGQDLFDIGWLLGALKQGLVDRAVKKDIIELIEMMLRDKIPYQSLFYTLFSRDIHGEEACKRDWPACFDQPPPKGTILAHFNLDKKVRLSELPREVRELLSKK